MSFTRLMLRASGVAMLSSLVALPVFAQGGTATVTQTNTTTGPRSHNTNVAIIKNSEKTVTKNTATSTNVVTVIGNTGGNKQKENTTAGSITTGDVTGTITITTTQNAPAI